MALNMTNATYGRSNAGLKSLIAEYEADINTIIKSLDGNAYTELKKEIKKYWQGADCDKFLAKIDEKINDAKSTVQNYRNTITNALNEDNTEFRKMQDNINF